MEQGRVQRRRQHAWRPGSYPARAAQHLPPLGLNHRVPVGYTDKLLYAARGNPYGVSYSNPREQPMPPAKLAAARYPGARVAKFAGLLAAGRA